MFCSCGTVNVIPLGSADHTILEQRWTNEIESLRLTGELLRISARRSLVTFTDLDRPPLLKALSVSAMSARSPDCSILSSITAAN